MNDKIRQSILQANIARGIDTIIVHCAATPEGKAFDVEDIRRWHKERKYKDIGYHFVVTLDGEIHQGRGLSHIGAHCFGHNTGSIGVCYIGGLDAKGKNPKDTRTVPQKDALLELLKLLKRRFPQAKILGHHDLNKAKACPCFDAKNEYKNL